MPLKDIEKRKEYNSIYKKKNKDKIKIINKKSRIKCNKHWNEYQKEYYNRNKAKMRVLYRRYAQKRRNTLKGMVDNRMSAAIGRSLKTNKAGRQWETLIGYTLDQLVCHLRKQFIKGMTLKRLSDGEIHIDHKVPRSHFKYTSPEDPQFKECWALHNLQPMWAKENISKGNRKYQLPLLFDAIGKE
jgi:hypothetical protein